MAREANTNIRKVDTAGTPTGAEQTRPGPVYLPSVDIFENDSAITVLADMPGVKAQDVKIDLHDRVLTLTAPVKPPGNSREVSVLREYQTGTFFRQFTLSDTIDQAKIDAKLNDGVLRLELPKVEKARPRLIAVKSN